MKGATTDENVCDPSRFQLTDIRSRDIGRKISETSEQNANVAWRDGNGAAVFADCPAALIDEPIDIRARCLRQRLIDLEVDNLAIVAIRPRHR